MLGTLSLCEAGISFMPTAAKPRQVLAMFATHADRVLPVATLVKELWGDTPPPSFQTTLQTYIAHIRSHLRAALLQSDEHRHRSPKDVLVTHPGGYLLNTGGGSVDVREFERHTFAGYRAMDSGDHVVASRKLRSALALWRGPALADINAGPLLRLEIQRLEEARLCAVERRIEADLHLGRHREVLSELTVLVRQHPENESLCGHFMIALYRSGRCGNALEAFQRLRGTLIRDLGIEPSAALRELHLAMLGGASGLDLAGLRTMRPGPHRMTRAAS
ncbi:AfsR/SARP family transcriptional regulator [Streptosporangium sp. NPDC023615]|uniref:AfsR/SARP family transcriptional regulator n=1 Tax=Streptosporangium sp. NPDC023615 TaxID=3154794 RepID=UPI003439C11E